jgi:hypothetical protein
MDTNQFYGRAGQDVGPILCLRVDGGLIAPGLLAPAWLREGMPVWVRYERVRAGMLKDDSVVFDGTFDGPMFRPRIKPVVRAGLYVVDRIRPEEPVGKNGDCGVGVVYLRTDLTNDGSSNTAKRFAEFKAALDTARANSIQWNALTA